MVRCFAAELHPRRMISAVTRRIPCSGLVKGALTGTSLVQSVGVVAAVLAQHQGLSAERDLGLKPGQGPVLAQ
jgi:hypothetical protein